MIPHDYKAIDTSPKPCKCERFWLRVSEITLAVTMAAFFYCLAVFFFSL